MACCDCRREMNAAPGHFCPQYGHRLSKSTASSVQADALARMTNPSEGSGDVQQVLAHPVYASPPAPQIPQPQPTVVYYQQGGRPITAPRPTDREDEQGLEGPEGVVDAAPARRHVRVSLSSAMSDANTARPVAWLCVAAFVGGLVWYVIAGVGACWDHG